MNGFKKVVLILKIIIIIAINVIILEFLSARYVHRSAPQRTILSFFKTYKFLMNFSIWLYTSDLSKYLNEQLGVFLNVKY